MVQPHGRSTAVFEVFTHKDLKAAIIPADVDFQKEMLVKRQAFYDNYFRPALLDALYFKNYKKY